MSLFKDNMGKLEDIMAFCSRFDGIVNDMACCKFVITSALIFMFFLCLLHSCYDDLLEQFWSCYKPLEGASLDSIVADVHYHNKFKLVGSNKKVPASKGPKAAAAAASSAVDKQGKEWGNLFEWLASLNINASRSIGCTPLLGLGFFQSAIVTTTNTPPLNAHCWLSSI
jgi:hypothetical protein